MTTIDRAAQFASHARLIDRRRFAFLLGDDPPAAVLCARGANRNADGGVPFVPPSASGWPHAPGTARRPRPSRRC